MKWCSMIKKKGIESSLTVTTITTRCKAQKFSAIFELVLSYVLICLNRTDIVTISDDGKTLYVLLWKHGKLNLYLNNTRAQL